MYKIEVIKKLKLITHVEAETDFEAREEAIEKFYDWESSGGDSNAEYEINIISKGDSK